MAREIAVDVASHSPQVDPILDELADVLADLSPMEPEIPYYSATLYDPRDHGGVRRRLLGGQPASRGAVRRGGAGGPGGRAPGVRGALATPAADSRGGADGRSLDMPLAGLAGMRREQEMPHGLRGFVADLHSAGAAVDFSVLYPDRAAGGCPAAHLDAPSLLLDRDGHDRQSRGAARSRCIRCWVRTCACRRSRSVTCGRARSAPRRSPGWPTTRYTRCAVLPGAAYCEMALAAARAVFGDTSEVRDVCFEQMLLLDEGRRLRFGVGGSPGAVEFAVRDLSGG